MLLGAARGNLRNLVHSITSNDPVSLEQLFRTRMNYRSSFSYKSSHFSPELIAGVVFSFYSFFF